VTKTALLLSGGMDSTSIAYWKRPEIAVTIDYGQLPAEAEIAASRAVCGALNISHEIIRVDCSSLGSGDLAGSPHLNLAPVPEWWAYRNQLLITLAGMRVIGLDVGHLLIGALATDVLHADGRPEFVTAISKLLEIQEGGLTVSAPAHEMTAAELVRRAGIPMEILGWAHSCHTSNSACGQCRGCVKHYKTMEELNLQPY
jgi:7-cyano-7-deazaguanine synthase